MKKFFKYFAFSILCIEIFNLFPFYQVNAVNDDQLKEEVTYKNGDLRCPPNSSSSECQLINNGNEAVVTHKEHDVIITKHVQKTDTVGRYKIWFEIQNNGEITTQVVLSDTYVYFIADASSTNQENVGAIKNALKSFYGKLEEKQIYFTGGSFAKWALDFSSGFKTSVNDLNINLNPGGSTSYVYLSLINAVNMFNKNNIKPEDKKVVVVLGDGLYYRCTDYKGSSKCHGDDKISVQSSVLRSINNSLTALRNQGVELYFIKYYGGEGSNGYTHYQNLYDLPDEYFDKSKFLYTGGSCDKRKCKNYNGYKIMYYAPSGDQVTNELVKYMVRAGNNIKLGDPDAEARVNSHFILKNGNFQETLDSLADKITNSINTVNIRYDYELTDYIYEAFIVEDTGFQGGKREDRVSGSIKVTTQPFYIKIAENLKNIDNDDNWYNTNNNFYLKFKKGEQEINVSSRVNPQVYWASEKKNVGSCLGAAPLADKTYDLSSKYYKIECKEGYDNQDGFVANFNVGGLTSETGSFQTFGFGFPVNVELSTNVLCTYKFDANLFKADYDNYNNCLSTKQENTPEYASCYKKKDEMDKIVSNYINIAGNSDDKGKNLKEYILDFENINADLIFNFDDNTTDSLTLVTSNFDKNIQCSNGISTNLVNNQTVYTDFSCSLSLSKKMQLDNNCVDMKTANQTSCGNSSLSGGNLYYMDLDKKSASILINIYNAGYMGNVGINLKDCIAQQNLDLNIEYRQIDVTDPFLKQFNVNRGIGRNFLDFGYKYDFTKVINDKTRTDGSVWKLNANYKFSLSKTDINNIRKNTESVNDYLGKNCYFTNNNKYVCDFTRSLIQNNSVIQ